jgi:AraC-like DNA-binding protein
MPPIASHPIRQSIVQPAIVQQVPVRATQEPQVCRPANDAAPPGSVSTVKQRLLHARSWTGVSAELFELHATEHGLVELPCDRARLLVMVNEVGGRAEIRTSPYRGTRTDYQGANHISLLPKGERAWCHVERMGYCRYLLVHFDAAGLNVLPGTNLRADFTPRLMFGDPTIWRYAQLIAQECEKPGELSEPCGQSLSLALFLTLVRLGGTETRETYQSRLAPWQLRRVTEFMRDHLAETLQLTQLAAISGLSPSHFGRAFKGSTGLPPHRWHLKLRVEQASAMLIDAGASLADVACATGFADQSHFTRVFSKIVGMSPGAWRRSQGA